MSKELRDLLGTSSNRAIGCALGLLHANGKLRPGDLTAHWIRVEQRGEKGPVVLVGQRDIEVLPGEKKPARKKTASK